jgi:hypothetical protein
MQAGAQFTPEQLIVAGRRAEAQGQASYAVQFYRYLADTFPNTTEALEAREALYRLAGPQSQGNGAAAEPGLPTARPPAPPDTTLRPGPSPHTHRANGGRQVRRQDAPPRASVDTLSPPRGYRVGRMVATMLGTIGWLLLIGVIVAGPAVVAALTLNAVPRGIREIVAANLPILIAGSVGALFLGLFAVFAGQVARATFDNADITRWVASALSAPDDRER